MSDADFPISIEVDPGPSVRAADTVGDALKKLEALASVVGQQMENKISEGLKRAAQTPKQIQTELLGGGKGLFGAGAALPDPDGRAKAELEQLIGGFNDSAKAASNARGAYQNVGQASSRLSGLTNALKSEVGQLALAYASLSTIKQVASDIVDLTDRYAGLQNQLRTVTSSQAEANELIRKLRDVSNETGTSLEANAQLYVRTTNAIKGLGYGSATALKFTEELNKVIATSGVDSATASAGVLQLSQGLSEGVLNGQNLKLVLNDVPQIAQAIADHMHVGVEQIKKLGEEGKLTSAEVVESFTHGTNAGELFENRVMTVGQAMQQARNDVEVFVGEVVGSLGPTMADVVANFEDVLASIEPAVKIIAQFVVKSGSKEIKELAHFIESSAEAFQKQFEAIKNALGPLGDYLDKVNALGGGFEDLAKLQDMTINATHSFADAVKEATDAQALLNAQLAFEASLAAKNAQVDSERKAQQEIDSRHFLQMLKDEHLSEEQLQGLYKQGVLTQQQYDTLSSASHAHNAAAARKAAEEQEKHNRALERALELVDPIRKANDERLKIANALAELAQRGDITFEQATATLQRYTQAHKAALDPLGDFNEKIEQQIDDLALTDRQMQLVSKQREIENDLIQHGVILTEDETNAIADEIAKLDEATQAHARRARELERAQKRDAEYKKFLRDFPEDAKVTAAALEKLARDFRAVGEATTVKGGAIAGLRDLKAEILDVGDLVHKSITSAFGGAEDAIVSLVTTGKADFHSLADSIFADTTRILLRLILIKTLGALFPGSQFGTAAAGIPLLGFAGGGDFTVGGEGGIDRNVVMFRATQGEHVSIRTPAQLEAARSGVGDGGGLAVAIYNRLEPTGFVDSINTPRGRRVVFNTLGEHPRKLARLNRG